MKPRFKDKVAIVTGAGCVAAGWGNGRAIAVRLAEEGALVLAVDRDPERLEETLSLAGAVRERIVATKGGASALIHHFEDVGLMHCAQELAPLGTGRGTRCFLPGPTPPE